MKIEGENYKGEIVRSFEIDFLPLQIKMDEDINIYVSGRKNKILMFNKNGKLLRRFCGEGEGPGEVVALGTFYVKNKRLYVNDWNRKRIEIFNVNSGKYMKTLKYKGDVQIADFIKVNNNGGLYIIGGKFNKERLVMEEFVGKLEGKEDEFVIKKISRKFDNEFIKAVIKGGKRVAVFNPFYKQVIYDVYDGDVYWGDPDEMKLLSMVKEGKAKVYMSKEGEYRKKISNQIIDIIKERYLTKREKQFFKRRKLEYPEYLPFYSNFFFSKELGIVFVTLKKADDKRFTMVDIYDFAGNYSGYLNIERFYNSEFSRTLYCDVKRDYMIYVNEDDKGDISIKLIKIIKKG